jgi:hypothetical protein
VPRLRTGGPVYRPGGSASLSTKKTRKESDLIGTKKLDKIHGGLVLVDERGNIEEVTYEQVLEEWLKENTPPGVDTSTICKALNFSYDTIQPKLKEMAEKTENKNGTGVRLSKQSRSIGQIGRRKYLWSWS